MKGPAGLRSRAAGPGDAEAIARIYNEGIGERIATFETRPRAGKEIMGWFEDGHPIVVVEGKGGVISFANASAYSPRECYSGVAEFSVYTTGEARVLAPWRWRLCFRREPAEPETTGVHGLPRGGGS